MRKPKNDQTDRGADAAGRAPAEERAAAAELSQVSDAEQQQSLERIEAGGIPIAAERRLRELGEHGGSYTSDLSVGDFALCHQLGLRPLAQVMGSSIYQVGYQNTSWPLGAGGFMFEVNVISDAWNEVRRRALNRLAEEATHLGADAVVGVDLRTGAHDWAENSIEYVVIGTAVRHSRNGASAARSRPAPVLSELAVDDYWKLVQAGIAPCGVVAWSAAFFVRASYSTQMMSGLGSLGYQNQELPEFTQGFYSAREFVMQRMTAQAAQMGASGMIGVRVNHGIQRFEDGGDGRYQRGPGLLVTFHAIGTAIRQTEAATLYAPQTTIDLLT
jgi:uncharacterized protein YbjQ (UPF0145 family)